MPNPGSGGRSTWPSALTPECRSCELRSGCAACHTPKERPKKATGSCRPRMRPSPKATRPLTSAKPGNSCIASYRLPQRRSAAAGVTDALDSRHPIALTTDAPGGSKSRRMRRRELTVSRERDRVAAADRPATEHRGVHADIDTVVLGRGPQNPGIFGQVPLRQRDHHAPGARLGDGQLDAVADSNGAADPVVLHEPRIFAAG